MTNRERAYNLLHYKSVDRMPAVHFGYWNELLIDGRSRGISAWTWRNPGTTARPQTMMLNRLLGWDFNWYTTVCPNNGLNPPFEYKILETLPTVLSAYRTPKD